VSRLLRSFYARLATIFLVLVLALTAGLLAIAFRLAGHLFDEVEQLLNRDYAGSIAAELEPLVAGGFAAGQVQEAIHYMMVLNPRVEIYILDAGGRVLAFFAPPAESLPRGSVELEPVLSFLATGRPILGEDPRSARRKPFSAATLRLGGETGYVYVILGGERYDRFLGSSRDSYYLQAGLAAFLLAVAATLLVGFALFFLLTRRLASLALAVKAFERGELDRRVQARGGDELGALGRSFNEMAASIQAGVEKLRIAENERREMMANISHDLRSPLASIRGHIETLLLKDLGAVERQGFLETVLRNIAGFQKLVEELFELARLEAGQARPRSEPFQLAELVQDVVLKLRPQAQGAVVSLTAELPQELPLAHGEIGLIERLLTNLIENGLRFTPAGGSVHVALTGESGGTRVSVSDTGSGIAPEDLPHVFERFYRADHNRSTGGAGLGLAIARQIAELHGARLQVESTPGRGSRFHFLLA
jgi:signal transduction histidine kinase